jgi:alpha-1,6-mannosyltransferase
MPARNNNLRNIVWSVLMLGTYFIMFRGLERESFLLYFTLFSSVSLLHLYPISAWGRYSNIFLFFATGLLIRLMAVSAIPSLSEDIYRYIWDGYLSQMGISPYAFTPEECIQKFSIRQYPLLHTLYPFLNSSTYYSVYPPVAQTFFSFGGWLAASWGIPIAITGLKTSFLLVELGGWFFMYQLFKIQNIDLRWFWALWLNPLLIVEWNFSAHIESLSATFLIASVFLMKTKKNYLSGVLLGLAVLVKLWPLIFAPFFIKYIKPRPEIYKWILAFILTGALGSIFFLLQADYFIHFKSSLDLYFRTFEFNASIYYVFRAIGTWWYGYNPIHITGPLCATFVAAICIGLYFKKKISEISHLIDSILICGIIYLLFATTVHPWYLSILVPFAYLNGRWSLIIWSYLIFISYHAYSYNPVEESSTILIISYIIVILTMLIDWKVITKVRS